MTVLQANNLVKIYGGRQNQASTCAINGIQLTIEEGEFVGIMGPSGSGKTTLLNLLSGIDKPSTGEIEILGKSIDKMTEDEMALFRRAHIGFIFQDFNLLESLTLQENIMLPMVLDKQPLNVMSNQSEALMNFFQIDDIMNKYPNQVSGGQKQRAAACRALMNQPSIVFADEPTGNLDSKSSNQVMHTLTQMNEEKDSTILMVTHDPFAASFCKRIVFIKDGKVEMDLIRKESRRKFFERILDCEAILGGDRR